jgi:HEPN domain-containing protein
MKQAQNYLKLNNKYLKEAEALMDRGDYVQASEKFWGAAAEIVKAVAAKRGIEIKSHGELYGFVSKLKDELHEPELVRLFSLASTLHQNFYEDWLPAETVRDHAEAVRRLVESLKKRNKVRRRQK